MQNKHIKIVVDTNIVASALFFGGKPLDLIELILSKKIEATATPKIIEEYFNTIEYLLNKYKGKNLNVPLLTIVPISRKSALRIAEFFEVSAGRFI